MAESLQQFCPIGAAQAGAGIPTRPGGVAAGVGEVIITTGDIVKHPSGGHLIQEWIEKANGLAQSLIEQSGQTGPKGRDGAGATNGKFLTVPSTRTR